MIPISRRQLLTICQLFNNICQKRNVISSFLHLLQIFLKLWSGLYCIFYFSNSSIISSMSVYDFPISGCCFICFTSSIASKVSAFTDSLESIKGIRCSRTACFTKTVNADVILSPKSANNSSACAYNSSSILIVIFVVAICPTLSPSQRIHNFYSKYSAYSIHCQYIICALSRNIHHKRRFRHDFIQ